MNTRGLSRITTIGLIVGGLITLSAPAYALGTIHGDINGDGYINFRDIDPFVELLSSDRVTHSCPIDYWPLDGIGRDYGCYANHGTLMGDATYSADVPAFVGIGDALSLDGDGDYVDLGPSLLGGAALEEFTLQAWFKTSQADDPVRNVIFATLGTDGVFYAAVEEDTGATPRVHVVAQPTGLPASDLWGPPVVDGRWHYLVVRKTATDVELWVDGVMHDTTAAAAPLEVIGAGRATIGCAYDSAAAHFFNGLIDEVKLHDRALSNAEIVDLSGMIAYFPFDGDAVDATGRGNDGSAFGGTTYVAGVRGSAIHFDGTTGYAELVDNGDLDGWGSFTISLWIQSDSDLYDGVGRRDFIYKGPPVQNVTSYGMAYDDYASGILNFNAMSAADWFDLDSTRYHAGFAQGQWFQVTCTYDGVSDMKMYVDGVAVGYVYEEGAGLHGNVWDNAHPLTVGRRPDSQFYFDGAIDELRIYDRELTPSEVQTLYQMTRP